MSENKENPQLKGATSKFRNLATSNIKALATTRCKSCHKEIPLHEETCPECGGSTSNIVFSVISGFAIAFFLMFLVLGFMRSDLWIWSILSIVILIVVNKLKTKFV